VVLIVVDTLRADHLSLYGYDKPTSPELDAFARSAVVFTNVTSQAPWTSPSMASLFSSLYPSAHGVAQRTAANRIPRLAATHETLAEALASAGWATIGVTSNPLLTAENGLAQGFGHYRLLFGGARLRAPAVSRFALEELGPDPAQPFFLYIHYMDVHGPYRAPDAFQNRFRPTGKPDPMPAAAIAALPRYLEIESAESLADYRAAYDAGIRYWDENFGQLLEELEKRSLLDRTLVIVTSDHGEEFFEHGGFNHGRTLFQEQVHVPLVFWSKALDLEPKRIDHPVALIDVAPTVLGLLGVPAPAAFQGTDRRSLLTTGTADVAPIFSEAAVAIHGVQLPTGSLRAVRSGNWKAVENLKTGELRVFDLARDPREQGRAANPAETERARDLFEAWSQANQQIAVPLESDDRPLDAKTRRRLEALGYIEPAGGAPESEK
jgi:arylsulfatase A-like enzyme